MMGIPPDVAAQLSLHDYEALLWNWNEAHKGSDGIEPPDPEATRERLAKINANPALTH
jgi:hypothetical protein